MSTLRTASILGPWRLDAKQMRGLAGLDAAPELLLGGEQEMLVERVGGNCHLDPLSAAGDDRQHAVREAVTHMLCCINCRRIVAISSSADWRSNGSPSVIQRDTLKRFARPCPSIRVLPATAPVV